MLRIRAELPMHLKISPSSWLSCQCRNAMLSSVGRDAGCGSAHRNVRPIVGRHRQHPAHEGPGDLRAGLHLPGTRGSEGRLAQQPSVGFEPTLATRLDMRFRLRFEHGLQTRMLDMLVFSANSGGSRSAVLQQAFESNRPTGGMIPDRGDSRRANDHGQRGGARNVLGWPKDASWPVHSCGNKAING